MNDAQITEYLRSRSRVAPPPSLAGSIMAAVDTAPTLRSWFASLVPAVAAVAVAVAVLMLAFVIGRGPQVGPGPTDSDQPAPSASIVPSASPSDAGPPLSLLRPGDVAEIPATDATGEWGTIRIERMEDIGGYSDAPIAEDVGLSGEFFVIEFFVSYTAERMPDPAQFGSLDWSLRPIDPNAEHFFVTEAKSFERVGGLGIRPDDALPVFPGAIDIFTTPTEGTIAFQVSRREANLDLELVYARTTPQVAIPARIAGPAPEPVPVATPTPGTAAPGYVTVEGLPFPVLDSVDADALFTQPDQCTNPEDGYTVTFPDDWYTNTETGGVPACSWFTPDFFEVSAPGVAPDDIWIFIGVVEGQVGYTSNTPFYLSEAVTVDGRAGRRTEYNPNPNAKPDYRGYDYVIPLGQDGPTLVTSTNSDVASDYALAKAVLDRIMATFTFGD
ncbi:MAG: hypothetical protein ABI534_04155 [Chloroflexota bacterium]